VEIQMDMTGTLKGENSYEGSSGWLKAGNMESDIKGTVEVMGQSVPLTMHMTSLTNTRKL
jgi:hypothetical protein